LKKVYDSPPDENGAIIIIDWWLNDEKTGPILLRASRVHPPKQYRFSQAIFFLNSLNCISSFVQKLTKLNAFPQGELNSIYF
jgi:hypothetical protein